MNVKPLKTSAKGLRFSGEDQISSFRSFVYWGIAGPRCEKKLLLLVCRMAILIISYCSRMKLRTSRFHESVPEARSSPAP